jgi:RNA polymerase sigma-70 factor (ECF subfamily)
MYVLDGYNHKEIAEKLDISESTSKTQLMRAKRLLKRKLKEEDYTLMESYA